MTIREGGRVQKRVVTDVVGPFKADRHVPESYIVAFNCFDDGEGD